MKRLKSIIIIVVCIIIIIFISLVLMLLNKEKMKNPQMQQAGNTAISNNVEQNKISNELNQDNEEKNNSETNTVQQDNMKNPTPTEKKSSIKLNSKPTPIGMTSYFTMKSCAEKIIYYSRQRNNEVVYNLLDTEYITKNKITKENVLEKIRLSNINKFTVKEAYQLIRS